MTNRILDLSPYKYSMLEQTPILDEDGNPTIVGKTKNGNGEEVDEVSLKVDLVEKEFTTEEVKKEFAKILGDSGQQREFFCRGREKHKRNKLADKIETSENGKFILSDDDYRMLEKSLDEMGGSIFKAHSILLDRVFDAPEVNENINK